MDSRLRGNDTGKTKPKITLVSIGHIDHGKSTLVGRLLYDSKQKETLDEPTEFASFLDALEEEREKGITIDTVYTPFEGNEYCFEIIDCPGHKEFIKNMMSGATHANSAQLLVSVALNEGIQEQTKRHLWLAKLFGINQVVVVINKMDLVKYAKEVFFALKSEVFALLTSLGYTQKQIAFVPTSGILGENVFFKSSLMPWWQGGSYLETLESFLKPAKSLDLLPLRFSIQTIDQKNNLVIGRVESGIIKVRQALKCEPLQDHFRVLRIKSFNKELPQAESGACVGLELKESIAQLKRGCLLIPRIDEYECSKKFEAIVYIMAESGLDLNANYTVRAGLQDSVCRVTLITHINPVDPTHVNASVNKTSTLLQHMAAQLEIFTKEPIFTEPFTKNPTTGRILLESQGHIIAAGIVTL